MSLFNNAFRTSDTRRLSVGEKRHIWDGIAAWITYYGSTRKTALERLDRIDKPLVAKVRSTFIVLAAEEGTYLIELKT